MAWARIEVRVCPEQSDPAGVSALHDLRLAGLDASSVRVHQVFYVLGIDDADRAARELFVDPVLEETSNEGEGTAVSVWKRPGVMDPVEASVLRALGALGESPERAVTAQTYWIEADAPEAEILAAVGRSLANEVIEEIGLGPVPPPRDLPTGGTRQAIPEVVLDGLSDEQLLEVSRRHVLALSAEEMGAIRDHFKGLGRPPRLGVVKALNECSVIQNVGEHRDF